MSAVSTELKGFAKRVELDAKSAFDTVSRAFTVEKKKRFTMSGEFSDEDIKTIEETIAKSDRPISVEASKAALEYYTAFSNVASWLEGLGGSENFSFSDGEKENVSRMWKRYYLNTGNISHNEITDKDIEENGLESMLDKTAILESKLEDDVATIKRCFAELRTKASTRDSAA